MQLILASSSPARASILNRLGIAFTAISPDVDETPLVGESPIALIQRLAELKARTVAQQYDNPAIIIGSDQVALIDDEIVGKPHTHERAVEQLKAASGQAITFYTGLCVLNTQTEHCNTCYDTTEVHFRHLTDEVIDTYLKQEQPYQCAGAFRSEGKGALLIERFVGKDPNTLIGLPVVELQNCLLAQQLDLLSFTNK